MSLQNTLTATALCFLLAVASPRSVAYGQTGAPAPQATPSAEPTAQPVAEPAAKPSAETPAGATPTRAPSDEDKAAAREAYGAGQSAFAAGQWQQALGHFELAFAKVPNPVVLKPVAECQVKLGRLSEAALTLEKYLSLSPEAADRAEVERRIAEIRATPSQLALSTTPAGASLSLDGAPVEGVTPLELDLVAGSHDLVVTLEGHEPLSEPFEAKPGVRHELQVELSPLPPPPPEPVAEEEVSEFDEEPVEPPSRPTAAIWTASIIGGAGLVAGTVLGFLAMSENAEFDRNPTEESADKGERLALFADVAFGVAAVAIVTALVLYVTTGDSGTADDEAGRASSPLVRIQPAVGPSGASATARIQF